MSDWLDRVRAALASRYRVERQLGSGGAAIVYLAEDLKHERQVAVKVLRPELTATLGADRFLREIKIAAKLSHPHILPVHDSGEAEGMLYYVMPVVEGESLRTRLAREKSLSIGETTRLLHDILDALQYAHQNGVVHRDIKPDNVLITGRHALVTDFGVAKAVSVAADASELDTSGLAIGTPAYMAPEQAAGDPRIDHRADIYSVGALAYELLSGDPPFPEDTPQAVLAAQVTKTPQRISSRRAAVSPALEYLVMKCLEKRPDDRWQTAQEVVNNLQSVVTPPDATTPLPATLAVESAGRKKRRVATLAGVTAAVLIFGLGWFLNATGSAVASGRPRIAVMPFANLGPPEDEYFANGVASAINARLSGLDEVAVISRTSTAQYAQSTKTAQEIGEELGVDYVLEGTIQRERPNDPTSRVRVVPQLVRVSDNTQLWADTYDEDLTSVFDVQTSIAERVVRAMDVTLATRDHPSLGLKPTDNVEAYEAYLRGHDYLEGNAGSGNANARHIAVEMFEHAIELDPNFSLAYAELSLAHMWLFRSFVDPSADRLAQAKAAVDSAFALDSTLPAVHLALGHYYYWNTQPDNGRALEEFKHVAEREPNNAYVRQLIGALEAAKGNWDQALENISLAADLDPREPEWAVRAGAFHLLTRRYEEAERFLDRAITLAPDYAEGYRYKIGLYLRWRGDTTAARRTADVMQELVTDGQVAMAVVQMAPPLVVSGAYDALFQGLGLASIAGPLPFDYLATKAEYYQLTNQRSRAQAYFDSLLVELERLPPERANDPVLNTFLGLAYAGLNRTAEAIERAQALAEYIAASDDALTASLLGHRLVWIYAWVGEYDMAIDQIERLLRVPSLVSTAYLRVEAFPSGLREHPRYLRLLAGSS